MISFRSGVVGPSAAADLRVSDDFSGHASEDFCLRAASLLHRLRRRQRRHHAGSSARRRRQAPLLPARVSGCFEALRRARGFHSEPLSISRFPTHSLAHHGQRGNYEVDESHCESLNATSGLFCFISIVADYDRGALNGGFIGSLLSSEF